MGSTCVSYTANEAVAIATTSHLSTVNFFTMNKAAFGDGAASLSALDTAVPKTVSPFVEHTVHVRLNCSKCSTNSAVADVLVLFGVTSAITNTQLGAACAAVDEPVPEIVLETSDRRLLKPSLQPTHPHFNPLSDPFLPHFADPQNPHN